MNKKVLALIVTVLCAIIASASVLAVKKRAAEKSPATLNATHAPQPNNGSVLKGSTASSQPDDPSPIATPENNVPEYVVYWHLFHHNNFLRQKATEMEAQGQDGSSLRDFYKREAGLDDAQASAFDQIAAACDANVAAVDAQAKHVIDEYRSQFTGGPLREGDPIPPPPEELGMLQEQRNRTILDARDQLELALGTTAFESFQTFVTENVAPQIKPENMDSLRPAMPQGVQRPTRTNPYPN
jgi:hypothetical protein